MEGYNKELTISGVNIDNNVKFGKIERNGVEDKIWLEINGKEYLYKIDKKDDKDKDNLGFREVLVSFLCHNLGIECVNAYPAYSQKSKQTGVIVESYLKDKKETQISLKNLIIYYSDYFVQYNVSLSAYSVEEIEEILTKLEKQGVEVEKNIVEKLKEVCLLDYVLLQCDRHFGNIEFLFSKENGKTKIKLAPMFDNGRCLGFYCSNSKEVRSLEKSKDHPEVCLFMNNRANLFVEKEEYSKNCVYFIAKEIVKNPNLRKIYTKLCNLNFDKVVDEIAKVYPKKIDIEYLDVIKEIYKIQQEKLQRYIEIAKKGNDFPYLVDRVTKNRCIIPQGMDRTLDSVFNFYGKEMETLRKKNILLLTEDYETNLDGEMKW